jgi:hypothetical protein
MDRCNQESVRKPEACKSGGRATANNEWMAIVEEATDVLVSDEEFQRIPLAYPAPQNRSFE